MNWGDDMAGYVHVVGSNVTEFKEGDRVAAFHEMLTPGGSYAEYAVAWSHTTFHIPNETTFEEAAAVPLASMTAAVALFRFLKLPQPWLPAVESIPLIIYGAGSSVGSYAIQLAKRSNIHPLVCIAGNSAAHVEGLLDSSRGDVVIDYRNGSEAVVSEIKKVLNGAPALYALDAVSNKISCQTVSKVLGSGAKVALLQPGMEKEIPGYIDHGMSSVGWVHKEDKDFGFVYFRYLGRGLHDWLKPQPQEVVPGGLGGIQTALENLKAGKASGVKYVFRIADTKEIGM